MRGQLDEVEADYYRLQRLQSFTEALAVALTPEDVVRVGDAFGGLHITTAPRFAHPALTPALRDLLQRALDVDDIAFADGVAAVPLSTRGRIDGAAVFVFEEGAAEKEVHLALAMARQCSLALERCRLFREEAAARRRAHALQEVTAGLARVRGGAEAGVVVVDVVAKALGCSAAFALVEGGFLEIVAARGSAGTLDEMQEAVKKKEAVYSSSCCFLPVDVDGEVRAVLALRFADGALLEGPEQRQLFSSVAQQTGLALERARLHDAERHALRAKDEFLALLGHEMRNPLMPITTALELMALRGDATFERERQVIERQTRHLVRLVDDLLDVTRITRGRVTLHKRPVELFTILARALEITASALERAGHVVDVQVPERALQVEGDEDRLVQVFSNLMGNAAKYTPRGGQVAVRARREGDAVVVDVVDNGRGIAPSLLPRVFELFVQGPRTLDRPEGGLGIGLAIVKSIVEMHGGHVAVTSDGPGKGSCFSVTLPRLETQPPIAAPAAAPPAAAVARPQRKRRILVVDDNEDLAHELQQALEELGQDVQVAHDGPSALQLVEHWKPELALLDIGLPVMDGYELCGRLKGALHDVVAVAITGYGQAADRERALSSGFDQHHVKPVGIARLVQILDSAP